MFWCVSFRLGAFVTVSVLHETWGKTRQTGAINVKVRATKSCHNFSQRTLMIHTIGPSTHVLVRFFPFGCIWDHFAIARKRAKLVQLMQNSCHDVLLEFFTTNTPDPYHWTLISCFGAFLGCIWDRFATSRNLVHNAPDWCN